MQPALPCLLRQQTRDFYGVLAMITLVGTALAIFVNNNRRASTALFSRCLFLVMDCRVSWELPCLEQQAPHFLLRRGQRRRSVVELTGLKSYARKTRELIRASSRRLQENPKTFLSRGRYGRRAPSTILAAEVFPPYAPQKKFMALRLQIGSRWRCSVSQN